MANTASAKKRARQAEVNRKHNASMRSALRTTIKKVQLSLDSKDQAAASEAYKVAVVSIDKAVSKGLIHRNKAARHKSRLNAHIRALAS